MEEIGDDRREGWAVVTAEVQTLEQKTPCEKGCVRMAPQESSVPPLLPVQL